MKKRVFAFLVCFVMVFMMFPSIVHADAGPKPSVVINFKGLEGEKYYVTLLSETKSTGPYSAYSEKSRPPRYTQEDEEYDIWNKFVSYKDADGYYFLQFFRDCAEDARFAWTYYPPAEFKVLLYFPEKDSFLASDGTFERYAFDSYYTAYADGGIEPGESRVGGIRIEKSYDFKWEMLSLFARIAATIAIEAAIALLFGFRTRKQMHVILIANIITQSLLNILLNIVNYNLGWMMFVLGYIVLEILVFAAEAVAYRIFINKYGDKKFSNIRIVSYAFVANLASFFIGLGIARIIPGIF